MKHHPAQAVLLAALCALGAMQAYAQEKTEAIQGILTNELRLYAEPLVGSTPIKSLDKALVPLPLQVQERAASFARIKLGSESYWVKTAAVRFAPRVFVAVDCQSSKDPLTQQTNSKVAATRGADGDCR